jgi:hypothetical protein
LRKLQARLPEENDRVTQNINKLFAVPIVTLLQKGSLAVEFDVPGYSLSVRAVRVY